MAGNDMKLYRKKLLKFLVALRDVGMETKYHIYDMLDEYWKQEREKLDLHRTKKCSRVDEQRTKTIKKQFIALAIVSKKEILCENFSVLKDFTDFVHEINVIMHSSLILSKVIHHDRVAVAMNADGKYFCEHGECRLLDPDRKILFKIIDEEILSKTGRQMERKKIVTLDKGGHAVCRNMENAYKKISPDPNVLLLYSYYIPCSLDFHNCSRLIHEFVKESGHEMAIGYERVYQLTDLEKSLEWLNMRKVTVISKDEIECERQEQVSTLIKKYDCSLECNFENDDVCDDDFDNYTDGTEVLWTKKHLRKCWKDLCRRISKNYNNAF